MTERRPRIRYFVHLACFCESATLDEKSVLSLNNIASQIVLTPGPGAPPTTLDGRFDPIVQITTRLVVSVTPSPQGHPHSTVLNLEFEAPDGEITGRGSMPMDFKKGRGNGLSILDAVLQFNQAGTYWMNVRVRKTLLTRIALHVEVVSAPMETPPQGGDSQRSSRSSPKGLPRESGAEHPQPGRRRA